MCKNDLLKQAHQAHIAAKHAFDEAHKAGMDALRRHDYHAMSQAIADESAAIAKHRAATGDVDKKNPDGASAEDPLKDSSVKK